MQDVHATLGPIDAIPALERVEAKLLELLGGLTAAEWDTPTIVRGWQVRHVAAHLLDTALRKLSVARDGYVADRPASSSPRDVRVFVDRLNAEGVAVYSRLSREILTRQMARASTALCAFQRAVDPQALAVFPVSWAGEEQSLNWFDTARELTERWHHQQQIRLALHRPGIMTPDLYHPVLDCFMRVLPYTYRGVAAPHGTQIRIRVDGAAGGEWRLSRATEGWLLARGLTVAPAAALTIPETIAWRIFTKGIARADVERHVAIEGDRALASHALDAVAIVG
jgi:uncharacterized protein (TIGR03083 family)